MSTYTVSTTEYTDARALMGIANILDRQANDVMPLDEEQVDALCYVLQSVRSVLPTHWCKSTTLVDLHDCLRKLSEDVSIAAVQAALKEQTATSVKEKVSKHSTDNRGLSDHE